MFDQNPDLDQFLFFGTGQASRSGFWPNIDDFLELYRTKKIENRKSGSNKFLGIPKAIQNRSKHSLRVPELRAPSTWSYRNFQNSKILTKFSKFHFFFRQNFSIWGIFIKKYFWPIWFSKNIFDPEKKIKKSELKKKSGHSFDVENWELPIGEVFRTILTLFRELGANMCRQNFKNPVIFHPCPPTDAGFDMKLVQNLTWRQKVSELISKMRKDFDF